MKIRKVSILIVAVMLLSTLVCFQLVACNKNDDVDNIAKNPADEYQEIELTVSNFFDLFYPEYSVNTYFDIERSVCQQRIL